MQTNLKSIWFFAVFVAIGAFGAYDCYPAVKLIMSTGIAFPEGQVDMDIMYKSVPAAGFGVGIELSPHVTAAATYNYQSFKLGYAGRDYIPFPIDFGGNQAILWSRPKNLQERHFFSFHTVLAEVQYQLRKRSFSPYVNAGAGVSILRRLCGLYFDYGKGEYELYTESSTHFTIALGAGCLYRVNEKTGIFIEARKVICFNKAIFWMDNSDFAYVPIRCGFFIRI
jgi:opacity protein-like surface antigen